MGVCSTVNVISTLGCLHRIFSFIQSMSISENGRPKQSISSIHKRDYLFFKSGFSESSEIYHVVANTM